ncbi:aromatic-ring hydroxylase C-terminal domain-containing protein [Streptomyces sp. NPDC004838]
MSEQPGLELTLAQRLSGLHVHYPPSAAGAHLLVGHRAPDLAFTDGAAGLFGLLGPGRYVLTDLRDAQGPALVEDRPWLVTRHHCARAGDRPHWAAVTAALIRPDGYVAWASEERDSRKLADQARTAVDATRLQSAW